MAEASKTIDAASVPTAELLSRFQEAKKAKEKYEENWKRNDNYYKSKAWEGVSKIAWFQSEPQYNKFYEYVETKRAMLADQRWGLDVVPGFMKVDATTDPMEMANKANKVLDFLWDDCRLQLKLAEAFIPLLKTGTGILKASFNPDNIGTGGIGQIEVNAVDPHYLYPDPDATSVDDADYIIEAKPVSLRYVVRRWPDKWQEIVAKGASSGLDLSPRGTAGFGPAPADEGKKIDLYECWYRDSTVAVLEETETEEKVGAKYPNGRYTLMTQSGVILEDKPCPYRRFPYILFKEIPMVGEFWGGCTLDKAAPIQQTINTILRSIIDNGLWLVHGVWIADDESGIDPKDLSTYGPRDVVIKRRGTEVRRDGGEQLPGHLFETLKQQVDAFDRVVNLPDVLRGIVGSRQPVATVAQQQEAGELRTRELARRVEDGLSDLGDFLFELVRNHWAEKRSVAVVKKTGGFDVFELSKDDFEDWEGRVRVVPGSTLPVDKAAAYAKAVELKTTLAIPVPDGFIIQLADIPGLEAAMNQEVADQTAADGMEAPPDAPLDDSEPQGDPGGLPVDPSTVMPEEPAPDMGAPPIGDFGAFPIGP